MMLVPQRSQIVPKRRDRDKRMTRTGLKPRVLVAQQGCIPIYRKSFFSRLNKVGSIEYVVVSGSAPRGTNLILAEPPFGFPVLAVKNREFAIFGTSLIWQPIVWRAIKGEFDAAVFGDEVKFVSNALAALALRMRGRPVLLWGFGFHQVKARNLKKPGLAGAVAGLYKRLLYRLVSGYLAYTEGGRRSLRSLRKPPKRIVVLRNTIDTEREMSLRALVAGEPLEATLQELRVRAKTVKLLYFGRLIPLKRVDLLVDYARRCVRQRREVDVIIFGQGSEEQKLHRLAHDVPNVVFHRPDDLRLARALRVSLATVIPGFTGLAINHSFAHGVPVLTRRGQPHSPEIEYLVEGLNGLMLSEDTEAFFVGIDEFIENKVEQQRLRDGAERSGTELDMSHMVAAFDRTVSECLETRKHT